MADLLETLQIKGMVKLSGIVRQNELPLYLKDAHVLLHTARFETGCAVIQEAMASGVAVVGTNVGLLSDIGDEFAVVVPVRDPIAFAEGILGLIADKNKYDRISRDAFQWILKFDVRWSFTNYVELLDKISKLH